MIPKRSALGLLVLGGLLACSSSDAPPAGPEDEVIRSTTRVGEGQGCKRTADCAAGLRCIEWFCRESGYVAPPDTPVQRDASNGLADAGRDAGSGATERQDGGSPLPDASGPSDAGGQPDTGPSWEDDGWRPTFEGSGGCQGAFHPDDETGECVPDDEGRFSAEEDCWNGGQINAEGVGRPCHPEERPCDGLAADCCKVDAKLYGAICVTRCPGGQRDCGPDSWCHRLKAICMPAVCQQLFDVWYPAHRYLGEEGFPCGIGPVNDSGVGTTCTAMGEQCVNLPRATECLGDRTILASGGAGRSSFCTYSCDSDADCGDGASCVYSNGPPFFCSPTPCAAFFEGKIFKRFPAASGPACE